MAAPTLRTAPAPHTARCEAPLCLRLHCGPLRFRARRDPGKTWTSEPRRPLAAGRSASAVPHVTTSNGVRTSPNMIPPAENPSSATATAKPAPQQLQPPQPYLWERNWVPVAPLSFLDISRPTPVMLLGQQLVVWRHASRRWVVMRDMCPHRLAPLSEGRLEAGATRLACSYHGWEFNETGDCTLVPQLANDPRAAATACASKRACITSFPTLELQGMLFVWLDASKEGLEAAAQAPQPRLLDEGVTPVLDWILGEVPADYQSLMEQGMDPSHANFLHHGASSFRKEHFLPFKGRLTRGVDLLGGFRWEHGAYEKKQGDMRAVRDFQPPLNSWVMYPSPGGTTTTHFITLVVPVRPGVCRAFQRNGLGGSPGEYLLQQHNILQSAPHQPHSDPSTASKSELVMATANGTDAATSPVTFEPEQARETRGAPTGKHSKAPGPRPNWLFRVFGMLPHWVYNSGLIGDQDLAVLSRLEPLMRRSGLTSRDYNLNSKADGGVAAITAWLRQAGYPDSLWGRQPAVQSGPTYGNWPAQELSLEQLLSRQDRHVRHCAVCQRGMKLVTAMCTALTAAAGVAAVAAVVLAFLAATSPNGAAAVGGWGSPMGAAATALALAVVALQGWSFREERFISGAAQWRRLGGFPGLASQARK